MNSKINNRDWYKSKRDVKSTFNDALGCGLFFGVIILILGIPLASGVFVTLNFDKIQNYFYRDIFFFPISQASGIFGIGALFLSIMISTIIGTIFSGFWAPKPKVKFKDLPKQVQIEDIKASLWFIGSIAIFLIPSVICCYYTFTSGIFFEKDSLVKRSLFKVESFLYSDIKEVRLETKTTKAISPVTYIEYSFTTRENKTVLIQEWQSQAEIDRDKLIKSISLFKDKGIIFNNNLP